MPDELARKNAMNPPPMYNPGSWSGGGSGRIAPKGRKKNPFRAKVVKPPREIVKRKPVWNTRHMK